MGDTRIYVACLASYNAGRLHGAWINVDKDSTEEALHDEITAMLADSKEPGAEEWSIHDHEGFEGIKLGENPDLSKVIEHARMLDLHGGAWAAHVGNVGEHYATESNFEDSYRGHAESAKAYAEDYYESMGTDLGPLAFHIDWESVAHEMQQDSVAFIDDESGGVYVFDR